MSICKISYKRLNLIDEMKQTRAPSIHTCGKPSEFPADLHSYRPQESEQLKRVLSGHDLKIK